MSEAMLLLVNFLWGLFVIALFAAARIEDPRIDRAVVWFGVMLLGGLAAFATWGAWNMEEPDGL